MRGMPSKNSRSTTPHLHRQLIQTIVDESLRAAVSAAAVQ
jgi:hypothetical protein